MEAPHLSPANQCPETIQSFNKPSAPCENTFSNDSPTAVTHEQSNIDGTQRDLNLHFRVEDEHESDQGSDGDTNLAVPAADTSDNETSQAGCYGRSAGDSNAFITDEIERRLSALKKPIPTDSAGHSVNRETTHIDRNNCNGFPRDVTDREDTEHRQHGHALSNNTDSDAQDEALMRLLLDLEAPIPTDSARHSVSRGSRTVRLTEQECREGITKRFYLFAHEEGRKDSSLLENDCIQLAKALGLKFTETEKSANLFLTTRSELKAQFLRLVSLRQQQIMDSLLEHLKSTFASLMGNNEKEFAKRIWDIWSRIRILQVQRNFHCSHSEILELVNKIWQTVLQNSLIELSRPYYQHEDMLRSEIDSNWSSISEWEIVKLFKTSDKDRMLLLVCSKMFLESVYCSGIPNSTEISKFSEMDLQFLLECLPSLNKALTSTEERSVKTSTVASSQINKNDNYIEKQKRLFPEAIEIFLEAINYLCNVTKMCNSRQWIWIHVSCHSPPGGYLSPKEPFPDTHGIITLACGLFTHVVFSVDCCFPKVPINAGTQNCCVIMPNGGQDTTEMDTESNLSCFTKLLIHSSEGFNCATCYSTMKSIFEDIQKCPCDVCEAYMNQISSRVGRSISTDECKYCKKLRHVCLKKGFIYPTDIEKFFEQHICDNKPHPEVVFHKRCGVPLLQCR